MKKPLVDTKAGGDKKGLSIVLEGTDQKVVNELTKLITAEFAKQKKNVLLDADLRSYEENVLVANQYLLDTVAAPLSPETLSLMVVIKLRERLKKVQNAKSNGSYVFSNTSWLGDTYYYQLRGKKEVTQQIISDCGSMKPDVWIVIDEPGGIYANLAKQVGVFVISPKETTQKMLLTVMDLIKKAKKVLPVAPIEQNQAQSKAQKVSILTTIKVLADPRFNGRMLPLDTEKLTYYRPKNFGKKVLGAYNLIINKLIDNHTRAIADLSKFLATQALHNKKPFKVNDLKTKAVNLCFNLLPVCTLVNLETNVDQTHSELDAISENQNEEVQKLFPTFDPEPQKPGISLISHAPRNEFEVLESAFFEQSDQSTSAIKKLLDGLDYEKKSQLLKNLQNSTNFLSNTKIVSYQIDSMSELSQLLDLLKASSVDGLVLQGLTPRYGYDIPKIIEEAGLAELFEQSYDLSLELYSLLQAAGFENQAQYAVLLGHRARYRISLNYPQTKKLIGKKLEKTSKVIEQTVKEVHPLIWINS